MSEFKPGDTVLIDCSRNPRFGSNAIRAKVIAAYDEGIYRYGCTPNDEPSSDKITIWCRDGQLKKVNSQEVQPWTV